MQFIAKIEYLRKNVLLLKAVVGRNEIIASTGLSGDNVSYNNQLFIRVWVKGKGGPRPFDEGNHQGLLIVV